MRIDRGKYTLTDRRFRMCVSSSHCLDGVERYLVQYYLASSIIHSSNVYYWKGDKGGYCLQINLGRYYKN
jgi:hypothetical protein